MESDDQFLLENQDIIGGINSALSRGDTLQKAMTSLFNAGYAKQKIERAARAYLELNRPGPLQISQDKKVEKPKRGLFRKKDKKKAKQKDFYVPKTQTKVAASPAKVAEPKKSKQDISKYEASHKKTKSKHSTKIVTLLLVFILIFLVGILAVVFLFKIELIDFINRLFNL